MKMKYNTPIFGIQPRWCREKFTALNPYIRKEESSQKNNPSSHLKDLEKHEHNKPKGRRKEITEQTSKKNENRKKEESMEQNTGSNYHNSPNIKLKT